MTCTSSTSGHLLLLTMRGIGEMVGSLGGWHLPPLSVPCVFGCSSEVKRLRCSPLFFEGMSSSRIWLREGRRCPTSFDGHDLFCHFKQSERCHGNLAISCKRTASSTPDENNQCFCGTCTYVATGSRERDAVLPTLGQY